MRIMKTGEPCPCCGQAIPAMLPVDKRLLASIVAESLAVRDALLRRKLPMETWRQIGAALAQDGEG